MVLDAQCGTWRFVAKDTTTTLYSIMKSENNIKNGVRLEGVLIKDKLREKGYELFTDEEGMMREPVLPMNLVLNPLCDDDTINECAKLGGPYGALILHKKGGIKYEHLKKVCEEQDVHEKVPGEDEKSWCKVLEEAVFRWEKAQPAKDDQATLKKPKLL